jgi:flagellar M-ring protein FliF
LQQIISLWTALEPKRRWVVAVATISVFLAVLTLARLASAPSMVLLYASLEGGAAGEVVQALEQRAVPYEVRGEAIYVDASVRDEIRMTLASQGLPVNTTAGYELLDGLSGFGTTSQMFDAAYWRAKEGELARTIVASPHIRAARVHISQGNANPFRREVVPTASVTVTTTSGNLSAAQARALQFLVASAVAGLTAEDVAVIDGTGGLVLGVNSPETSGVQGNNRADELRQNVERLLEAHVGFGRVVVELSIDTVTDRETIVERRFDPESRVAISTETEERSSTSNNSGASGVTVSSNLPDGAASGGDSNAESRDSETRERVNFEVSETNREVQRGPGAVRRMTVAVLIDGRMVPDADGVLQWEPRPEDELQALRDLVTSAVGYDETRGDVVTLRSLRFEQVSAEGSYAEASMFDAVSVSPMSVLNTLVLAVVALILSLFVIRPIVLAARRQPILVASSLNRPQLQQSPQQNVQDIGLTGEIDDGPISDRAIPVLPADGRASRRNEDPVERLRTLIAERQDETVEILRNWMEDREESV